MGTGILIRCGTDRGYRLLLHSGTPVYVTFAPSGSSEGLLREALIFGTSRIPSSSEMLHVVRPFHRPDQLGRRTRGGYRHAVDARAQEGIEDPRHPHVEIHRPFAVLGCQHAFG